MDVARRGQQGDNAELRRLLVAIRGQGWDSPAGRELLAWLGQRARAWAYRMERQAGLDGGALQPADLVTDAWLVLHRSPERVAAADSPWIYLWDAVRRRTSVSPAGAAVCSERLARHDMQLCR